VILFKSEHFFWRARGPSPDAPVASRGWAPMMQALERRARIRPASSVTRAFVAIELLTMVRLATSIQLQGHRVFHVQGQINSRT